MKKSKLFARKTKNKLTKNTAHIEMDMNKMAKEFVNNAIEGKDEIKNLGNFIFLSTVSGEAWVLEHRENLALRLADHYEELPYKITETKTTFHIGWTEEFHIIDGVFIAGNQGKQSHFNEYPVGRLRLLIDSLK